MDLKDKRPRSVLKLLGADALVVFLEADALEEDEAAALGFAPVNSPCADIVGRKEVVEENERTEGRR